MPIGKITALRVQANDSQRVNVFIADEYAIGISLSTLAREKLFVGKEVDDAGWERLAATERHDKTLQAAMRLLEQRPRSVAELRQRLQRKEHEPQAIDAAIERLGELGMVDDTAFSRYWVDNRQAFRPRGTMAIRNELQRKGVKRDVIDAVLNDPERPAIDEHEQALELARTALHKYATVPDRASFQRKLGGFLMRRGYTYDTIGPIIDMLWKELSASGWLG
ncbi:regulatory protein RecX [Candidatus Gracilibacteria bacterium]|nr:regulatory protein RecX [Candidatus Gracilibacteria bacterium]